MSNNASKMFLKEVHLSKHLLNGDKYSDLASAVRAAHQFGSNLLWRGEVVLIDSVGQVRHTGVMVKR